MSCNVELCHVIHVMSCWHVMLCHVSCHVVMSRCVMSRWHVTLCHVTLCHVMLYHVMLCHVNCHVVSCHDVVSCHVLSVMLCHVTFWSCLVMWFKSFCVMSWYLLQKQHPKMCSSVVVLCHVVSFHAVIIVVQGN